MGGRLSLTNSTHHTITIIEVIACSLSAFSSVILAGYLLKNRRAKMHYRLSIGLCVAFAITNCLCLVMALTSHIPDNIFYSFHLAALTVGVLYISTMFLNFLLKSIGYSEEDLSTKDKYLHPALWGYGGLYFFVVVRGYWIAADVLTGIVLIALPLFVIASTFYIIASQRKTFSETGEVMSPLLTSRTKEKLLGFQVRLIILMFLALVAAFNVPMIIYLSIELNDATGWSRELLDGVIMACSLTGFLVSTLLASTPELKRYYKQRRMQKTRTLPLNSSTQSFVTVSKS